MERGEIRISRIYKVILIFASIILLSLIMAGCTEEGIKSQGLYKIEIAKSERYEINVDKDEFREGESVLITVENIAQGYSVDKFYYLIDGDESKNYITNPFIMPDSDITLYAQTSDNEQEKFTINDLSLGDIDITKDALKIMPKEDAIFIGIKDIYTGNWVYLNSIDNEYLYLFDEYREYINPNLDDISYFKDYTNFSDKDSNLFETTIKADYENGLINYNQYEKLLRYYYEIKSKEYSIRLDNFNSKYEVVFNSKRKITNNIVEGVEYSLFNDSNVAVVIGSMPSYDNLVIPEEINGNKVIGVMPKHLENSSKTTSSFSNDLISISLPDSITQILPYTFYRLTNLNSFMASSIMSIGDYAFYSSSLSEIKFGDCLTEIGKYCFAYCPLTMIVLPETINSVGVSAFENCNSLTDISLYSKQVDMLSASKVYDNVKTIKILGESTQLPLLNIGENYFTLYSSNFTENVFHRLSFSSNYDDCGRFSASCMIGDDGDFVYKFNFKLKEELSSIFELGCWELNSQIVSDNISFECEVLLGVDFNLSIELREKELFEINGVTYQKIDGVNELVVISSEDAKGEIEIINCLQILDKLYYVTQINARAFYSNKLITSIFIPRSITIIEESAFNLCVSLEKVEFDSNSSLRRIQTNAFANCSSLNEVNLNNCNVLENIETFAFIYCSLLDLYIPNSVQNLGAQWGVNSIKFDSQQAFNTFTFMQIDTILVNTNIDISLNQFFSYSFGVPLQKIDDYYVFIR